MKKAAALIAILLPAALLLTSCDRTPSPADENSTISTASSTAPTTLPPDPEGSTSPEEPEIITRVKYTDDLIRIGDSKPMYLFYKTDYELCHKYSDEDPDDVFTVELYVSSPPYGDGSRLLWEDGQRWSVLVRNGDYAYPLVSDRLIQMGQMKYAVCVSDEDALSFYITVWIQSDYGLSIEEYHYNATEDTFTKKEVYHSQPGYHTICYSQADAPHVPEDNSNDFRMEY